MPTVTLADHTKLVTNPVILPPYAARGISATLETSGEEGEIARDINGGALDMTASQMRKYRLTLNCTDGQVPGLDGIWKGQALTVDCPVELAYIDGTGAGAARPIVAGSERTADGFVFYRPQLSMLVESYRTNFDEWQARVGWTLVLIEA